MSRFTRFLGFFSAGVGVSLIIGYWLKQEEIRSRERLLGHSVPPAPPSPHIVLANKTLNTADSRDDLTAIRGVGPKTAEALQAIGITTYASLAASSAPELLQRLENVRGISIEKITLWIQEAKGINS